MLDVTEELIDQLAEELKTRVKKSRYKHSLGVSDTCGRMARIYGVDEGRARLAGLLHDWDKGCSFEELQALAREHHLESDEVIDGMPGVLHAVTAPIHLKEEYDFIDDEILSAISKHTVGCVEMGALDIIVFVADLIEPRRDYDGVEDLRSLVGKVSLDELYYQTYKALMIYLVSAEKPVYPDSLRIWNALVVAHRE